MAESCIRTEFCFRFLLNHPKLYVFLRDTCETLQGKDEEKKEEISRRLASAAGKILNKGRLIFLAAAPENELAAIEAAALSYFKRLPALTDIHTPAVSLPKQARNSAAFVDSPSQEIRMLGDFRGVSGFKGRYLPFLLAAGDKYIKPAIRYQGGAYDSGIDFLLPGSYFTLWSTADPKVEDTIRVFRDTGNTLEDISISSEDLKGYILSAYAQALPPSGILNAPMRYMRRHFMGIDSRAVDEMISDIRNADISDQPEAARIIHRLLSEGPLSVAGNERSIRQSGIVFDELIDVGGLCREIK
jgi:hypothetical protein